MQSSAPPISAPSVAGVGGYTSPSVPSPSGSFSFSPGMMQAAPMLALAGLDAGAMYVKSQGQLAQGKFAQKQATLSAELATASANQATVSGNLNAQTSEMKTAQIAGKQKATLAAQGIVAAGGSVGNVEAGTREIGALDAITIRNNAAREAFGYKVQAQNYTSEANMAPLAAEGEAGQTFLTGGVQLLQGAYQAGYFGPRRFSY